MTKFKTTTVKWKDEEDAKLFAAIKVEDEGQAESEDDFDIEDQRAHSNLINDITKISKRRRIAPAPRNVRASAEEGGTRVDSKDILKRIGQTDLTNAVKKISTLPKPQEKVVLRRLKRAAGYKKVSVESEKWQNLVSRRRTADQLKFPLQAPDVRIHTALKTEETKMKTPLEQEVYSLLLGAKMMEDKKETEAELTRKRAMSLEELKERNRLAWKLKAEKRKLEYKAWQQNKNKSRKFHRVLRREKLKKQKAELEQLEKTNPEAALEMLEELERARVEERMTLRHKQSKWAHLQGFRATRDPKAMTALKDNKDVHQELLAKRKRQESSSEEEEENIEEKLEALKKERQAAIEAGLFDPANPWTAGLFQQVPDRLAVTPDSAIDDSFVNFKKFWDEVNRRRLMERQAQKMAERDVCDNDNDGENGEVDNDTDGEVDNDTDGEVDNDTDGEVDNDNDGEVDNDDGNEEMEATYDNGDDKTEKKSKKNSKKRKLKSGNKRETKKMRINEGDKAAENNSDTEDNAADKIDEEESTDDIEIKEEDDKKGDEKKTKKGKGKKKKVIGCKSIKKSNLKFLDKGKKKKKASNKTKSGVKEGSKSDDSGKKKLNKKQEEKEGIEEKKKKKNQKKKRNTQNDAQKMNNGTEKDDNKANKNGRDEKVEEKEDINNSEDVDLEEQLISIDSMFNQAELGLQRKLKKKLERMGIRKTDGQEWTKVQTRKKTKKVIKGEKEREGKSILPKIEEYDFKIKKNLENLDETVERAKTLEDMDKLQKATENEDQVQKAIRTLQVAASKENGVGNASGADKKLTGQKILQVDPSKFIEVDAKKLLTAMPDTLGRGDEALDDDDDEDNEVEDIIREAFADDYLVSEFKSEKDLAREQDKPKALCLAKPGWGNWTGPNIKMSNRLRKRFTIRAPKAPPRKDDTLGNVIYDEKADVHDNLRKVMVSELPFPFSSVKEFEASVRAPIGRLFVPEKQHQNLTAPPVVTKIGTIIEPMTEEELLKHEKRVKGPSKGDKKTDKAHRGNKQTRWSGKRQGRQRGNCGQTHTGIVNKRK